MTNPLTNAKQKVTIYLPPNVRRFAKMRAAQTNSTLSDYVADKINADMEDMDDIKTIDTVMNDPNIEWVAWENALKELNQS
jgi:predicted DNA-binding protein